MPIIDRQRKLHEIGRIRLGEQVAITKRDGSPGTAPKKLETFRFTSANKNAIDAIAGIHGGIPSEWADAPTGRQWEVTTESDSLRILVPHAEMSFSQAYELWSGGGCKRRCNGVEMQGEMPCVCDPDNRECKPHTRVSVMLADVPVTGLWRFDTQSEFAADELAGQFELAEMLGKATGKALLPATVRIDQRERKKPGQPTKKFGVPVVEFDVDVSAFVGGRAQVAQAAPTAQLKRITSVTPIQQDETPAPSVADQLQAVSVPEPRKQTARSAPPIPATGVAPRPASQATEAAGSTQKMVDPYERADTSAELGTFESERPSRTPRTSNASEPKPPSQPSMRRLFAILGGKGIRGDEDRHQWASDVLNRTIVSFSELSQADVTKLNDAAEGKPEATEPEPEEEQF